LEYIECPSLRKALELGLTSGKIPKPKRIKRRAIPSSQSKDSNEPNSLEDLDLDDAIFDDQNDDDDDFF
jgi:hypothetical protein